MGISFFLREVTGGRVCLGFAPAGENRGIAYGVDCLFCLAESMLFF